MDHRLDAALEAHRIIAPLLAPGLEPAEKRTLRERILLTEGISERTLRRMMQKFQDGKLEALKPKERADRGRIAGN